MSLACLHERGLAVARAHDGDVADIQRIVELLATEVPRVQKVVIPGAGHLVNLEGPAEFNHALPEFPQPAS